jgi:hypothetical protein
VSKNRRGGVVVTYCGLGKIVLNVDSLCFNVIRLNQHRLNTVHWLYSGVSNGCCVLIIWLASLVILVVSLFCVPYLWVFANNSFFGCFFVLFYYTQSPLIYPLLFHTKCVHMNLVDLVIYLCIFCIYSIWVHRLLG